MLRKELEEKEREMKKLLDLKKSFSSFEELRMKMEFAVLKCRNLNLITVEDIHNMQETLSNLLRTENHKEELNEVIRDLEKKLEDLKEIQRQEQIKSKKEVFEQMNLTSKDLLQKHENGNECSLLEIQKMIKSINELVSKYQHDKDLQSQVEDLQTQQIRLTKVNKNLEVKGCSDEIHEVLLLAKGIIKNNTDGNKISIQEIDNMMQSIDKLFSNQFKKHKHDLQERFDELNSEKAKLSQIKRTLKLKDWEHTIVNKNLEIQKLVDMHENGTHCPLPTIDLLRNEINTLLRQVPRCQKLETVITDLETKQNRLSDVREKEEERINEKKKLQLNTDELKDLISNPKNAIDALVRNKSINSLSEIENIVLQIDEYLNSLDYKEELQILINELKALQKKAEMKAKKRQKREEQDRQRKEDKEAQLRKEQKMAEQRQFDKEQAELKEQREKQEAKDELLREKERKRLIEEKEKRKKLERKRQEELKQNKLKEKIEKEKQDIERLQKEEMERRKKEKKLQEEDIERRKKEKKLQEEEKLNQDRRKEQERIKDEEIKLEKERNMKKEQIQKEENEINVEKAQELQRQEKMKQESEKQELKLLLNKLEKQIEEQLLRLDSNEEDIEQNRKNANDVLEQEIEKRHLVVKKFETETKKYKDVERSLNDNILKLQAKLEQNAKNKEQFEKSQFLKKKQMDEDKNELMGKWQKLETEDFRIKQEKSLLYDEKQNFATEKSKKENEWENWKQSEEDKIKRENDALVDKSQEIQKQLDELAIKQEAVDERMRAISDSFEFQKNTKDKNSNQSGFQESNSLKYTRGDDEVDDNLSYHKGNGCVITVDDETALGSDFVCDINPEFSSEFEGTVQIVPVKSISRPMSAAINIKHANKNVTNKSGNQAVYIPHRATVTNEETSIYGAIDGGDWKEMDKAYSVPYNADKLVDWIGTDVQFKSEASFIVVAKERFQLIKLDRFQKQEQSTVDDQIAINVHKDTFKTDTTMKLVVRLIQEPELGLCLKYHPECEHLTACSSLVTLRVGLSTQEDIELWIKAKTKSQLSVVPLFIHIGDCWKRADTEWVETKPPRLVVTLPKGFQTYKIIGVKTVRTAEVNRDIGRVIYEHTQERIVRLLFRQKKMAPTEAILVCARSDQTKHKCYELAKMGYTAGGLESEEFCNEDKGLLRVSFTGNVYCEQVERGSSFRLQFLSELDVAVCRFTLYGAEGWLAPDTDEKCISGKINVVRETEHEQTIMKKPVFLPK